MLNDYPDATTKCKKSLFLDKYEHISANDHEKMQWASEFFINHDLSIPSHVVRCNYEKQILASVLATFNLCS